MIFLFIPVFIFSMRFVSSVRHIIEKIHIKGFLRNSKDMSNIIQGTMVFNCGVLYATVLNYISVL